MCPVQWSRPVKRPASFYFVNTKGRVAVLMVDDPANYHVLKLHWLDDIRDSRLCSGDDCKWCREEVAARNYCYAPCLHFAKSQGRWYHAILPIGDPSFGLAQTDYRGMPIWIGPSRDPADRKRVISYGHVREQLAPLPSVITAFDIRPHLLRRWGLYREADLIGCERHEASPIALEATGTDGTARPMVERAGPSLFTGETNDDTSQR
jgi:hypothetical protein